VIDPQHETARPPTGPGFSDAVTFAWGDRAGRHYGLARAGLAGDGDGDRTASALAVLFAGREPVAATARGAIAIAAGTDFADLEVAGLHSTVRTPLREWTVSFDGGESGFALTFEALGAPAELDPAEPVARAGGMVGYEQLCRVRGTVRTRGAEHTVDCLGQRSHTWGEPDWKRIESTRTVTAWLDDGSGVSIATVRPEGKRGHDAEAAWGVLLDPEGSVHIDEPRVSTTYDADGRQRRAGLELWVGEDDDFARRVTGEVLCGSTFDLGQLRLDCSFFSWRAQGRDGVGRYDLVRRA
jgi:hypothetical protein